MLNKEEAEKIVKKFSPTTKLVILDRKGQEGIYMEKTNEILITYDWNIAGLLHEITHAILYKEDGRRGHDGVFADRFTRLVGEVFCNHISQDGKKVSFNIKESEDVAED